MLSSLLAQIPRDEPVASVSDDGVQVGLAIVSTRKIFATASGSSKDRLRTLRSTRPSCSSENARRSGSHAKSALATPQTPIDIATATPAPKAMRSIRPFWFIKTRLAVLFITVVAPFIGHRRVLVHLRHAVYATKMTKTFTRNLGGDAIGTGKKRERRRK
ncbi:hypothetical protein [Paludibacterium paludis]|uniref:hypothetical protein n=1 Tax=Paludibacterium paludis TaxID=1225769 RepID=UPI001C03EEC4|nr:hypothetical protein [Paludibacterium paludis]